MDVLKWRPLEAHHAPSYSIVRKNVSLARPSLPSGWSRSRPLFLACFRLCCLRLCATLVPVRARGRPAGCLGEPWGPRCGCGRTSGWGRGGRSMSSSHTPAPCACGAGGIDLPGGCLSAAARDGGVGAGGLEPTTARSLLPRCSWKKVV